MTSSPACERSVKSGAASPSRIMRQAYPGDGASGGALRAVRRRKRRHKGVPVRQVDPAVRSASPAGLRWRRVVPERHAELARRVTPIELFFDLVFVFAFTQVTTLLVDDPTWGGLSRGLLVVAVLWWAWASYAWLTNTIDADDGIGLAVMLVATAALFVAALAVPEGFGTHRLVFALAFLVVLVMFVGLFAVAGRAEADLLAAVLRMARTTLLGGTLIVAGTFADSDLTPVFWLAALTVGFVGPILMGVRGWRVHAGRFAERHGLILIIAIGEALVAIGFGARGTGGRTPVIGG